MFDEENSISAISINNHDMIQIFEENEIDETLLVTSCRCCLQRSEVNHPIFQSLKGSEISIASILNNYIVPGIIESQYFSQVICDECLETIIAFHNFVIVFQDAQSKLLNILDQGIDLSKNIHDLSSVVIKQTDEQRVYVEVLEDSDLRHEIVSTNESTALAPLLPFVCDVCGRAFRRRSYLTEHTRTHVNRTGRPCPVCAKVVRGRSNMARHQRIHRMPKGKLPRKYVCDQCGDTFTTSSVLKTHIFLKHVRKRDHQCMICDRRFALRATLQKHINRHRDRDANTEKGSALEASKRFPCEHCTMGYRDKSSLTRHVELKHSEDQRKYHCVDCPKEYTTHTNLARHQKKEHPDRPAVRVKRGRIDLNRIE